MAAPYRGTLGQSCVCGKARRTAGAGRCPVYYCDRRGGAALSGPCAGGPGSGQGCAAGGQCYSAGQTFADQTSADGFADGIAEEIRTLGSLPGTVTLLQIDPNGYTVQRLLYQENGMYAIYDADGGYRVFRAEDRLQYGAGVGHAAA